MAFFTARNPSWIASLICVSVCLFGPLIRTVTDIGFLQSSINVYFSSPCKFTTHNFNNIPSTDIFASKCRNTKNSVSHTSPSDCAMDKQKNFIATDTHIWDKQTSIKTILTRTYSYTRPAKPRYSEDKSSNELTATPPHARVSRSMFRLFARRSARIPALANISSESGSMPCRQQKQAKESFKFCTHNHLPEAKSNQKLNLQSRYNITLLSGKEIISNKSITVLIYINHSSQLTMMH